MIQYKGHPVYGVAIPAQKSAWSARGLVFDRDEGQTARIMRLESDAGVSFKRKQLAEDHGLTLCRNWIDEQAEPKSS